MEDTSKYLSKKINDISTIENIHIGKRFSLDRRRTQGCLGVLFSKYDPLIID